jgi:hypothetical protein
LKKILENPNGVDRAKGLEALLAMADASEVKQLLDWVTAMPDSAAKRVALGKVMKKWGELDGAAAAAYGVDTLQQTGNTTLLRSALMGWAQSDPSSSMQYLQGLGLGNGLVNNFSRDILGVWSNLNPQEAASYLQANPGIQGGGGPGRGGGAFSTVAGNWAAQDPQAAANWALSLSSGADQGAAMNQVIQKWVNQDPASATAFVNSQPPGQVKDGELSNLARGLGADDPASAMKYITQIGDVRTETRAAMTVLGEAGVFTPNGPDMALAQSLISALPPTTQQQVLQRLTNGSGRWGGGGGQ